jgi:LAS superfamily LD-carboxypeptidase LdcB
MPSKPTKPQESIPTNRVAVIRRDKLNYNYYLTGDERKKPVTPRASIPKQHHFKLMLIVGLAIVALVLGILHTPKHPVSVAVKRPVSVAVKHPPLFNKTRYSLTLPTSAWVVVNKQRPLPDNYVPPQLVVPNVPLRLPANDPEMSLEPNAAKAFEMLVMAADQSGIKLMLGSGYRSQKEQEIVFNNEVRLLGDKANQVSAKPGTSEHQTGLALDVDRVDRMCEFEQCFDTTPEGKWVAVNAYKYGFIVRYAKDKTAITGYEYEPWHLRYVGNDLSVELHDTHIETLEEFFSLNKS